MSSKRMGSGNELQRQKKSPWNLGERGKDTSVLWGPRVRGWIERQSERERERERERENTCRLLILGLLFGSLRGQST